MSVKENIINNALAEITPLREKRAMLAEELAKIDEELTPLEEWLKVLEGSKAKSKASRKAAKPYAKKQNVMDVCLTVVQDNQPIAKEELMSFVSHKLANEGGFSLSGVKLRFEECMVAGAFSVDANGTVTLAEPAPEPPNIDGSRESVTA